MVVIMMGVVKVGTHRDVLFVNGILGITGYKKGPGVFFSFLFPFYSIPGGQWNSEGVRGEIRRIEVGGSERGVSWLAVEAD